MGIIIPLPASLSDGGSPLKGAEAADRDEVNPSLPPPLATCPSRHPPYCTLLLAGPARDGGRREGQQVHEKRRMKRGERKGFPITLFSRLWTREENEIAIVSHSGFLYHTLSMYNRECHPMIRQEVGKHFANCEVRSMVLVDRSMLQSDSEPPSCNFPGRIPARLDLPNDVTDKKHVCEALKN